MTFNNNFSILAGWRNISDGNHCAVYGNFIKNTSFIGNTCCLNGCYNFVGNINWDNFIVLK